MRIVFVGMTLLSFSLNAMEPKATEEFKNLIKTFKKPLTKRTFIVDPKDQERQVAQYMQIVQWQKDQEEIHQEKMRSQTEQYIRHLLRLPQTPHHIIAQ